jgi:hypothetical protein
MKPFCAETERIPPSINHVLNVIHVSIAVDESIMSFFFELFDVVE